MGLMAPKIESAEALKVIAEATEAMARVTTKPWYKKPEIWAIFIAAISVISTIYTIYQSSQTTGLTERPYVSIEPWGGLDNSSVDFQSSKRIILLFRLTNNGRTPANHLAMTPGKIGVIYSDNGKKVQSVGQVGATVPTTLPAENSVRVGVILAVADKDFENLKNQFSQNRVFFTAELGITYEGMSDGLLKEGKTEYSVELSTRGYEILVNSMQ